MLNTWEVVDIDFGVCGLFRLELLPYISWIIHLTLQQVKNHFGTSLPACCPYSDEGHQQTVQIPQSTADTGSCGGARSELLQKLVPNNVTPVYINPSHRELWCYKGVITTQMTSGASTPLPWYEKDFFLPYDPMVGIGTAAVLSSLFVLFVVCLGLERLRDYLKERYGAITPADIEEDSCSDSSDSGYMLSDAENSDFDEAGHNMKSHRKKTVAVECVFTDEMEKAKGILKMNKHETKEKDLISIVKTVSMETQM